ncbi:ribosome maturation factor RimP [Caenispirillum salinarum]|uniref:ribosome maturation factor RimP n=1 Tax=Caenispirillum salinarum TaxID=859058 RepID=UPI00384D39A7
MDLQARIAALIEPTLTDMGYELVRVQLQGSDRQTLQIMADRADGAPITVEDCEAISRAISAILDVEDPIGPAYVLEVSSPGIDRPLTRRKDFERWKDFDAKVEAPGLVEGRKRFQGLLRGFDAERDEVILQVEGEGKDAEDVVVGIPFSSVTKAKLILNDALWAWAEAQQAAVNRDDDAAAADDDNKEG